MYQLLCGNKNNQPYGVGFVALVSGWGGYRGRGGACGCALDSLLFRVPEFFGRYTSLQSARSDCGLNLLGRHNLRCQGQSLG